MFEEKEEEKTKKEEKHTAHKHTAHKKRAGAGAGSSSFPDTEKKHRHKQPLSSSSSSFFDSQRGSLSLETFLHDSEFVSLRARTSVHLTMYPNLCKKIKAKELSVISQNAFLDLKRHYVTQADSEHKYFLMKQIEIILVEHIESAYAAYKKTYQTEHEMPVPQSEKDTLLNYFKVAIRFAVDNPAFGKFTDFDYWADDSVSKLSTEELTEFSAKKVEQLAARKSFAISRFQYENLPAPIKQNIQNIDAYKDLIAKLGDCFLQQNDKLIEFQKDESKASDANNFPYIAETSLKDYVFHNIQDACQASKPKTDAVMESSEVKEQLVALSQQITQAIIDMIRNKKGNSLAADDGKKMNYYIKRNCLDSFLKKILFSDEKKDWLSSKEEIKKKQDELTKTIKVAFGLVFTNESERRLSQVSRVASTSMPYLPPLLPSVNKI